MGKFNRKAAFHINLNELTDSETVEVLSTDTYLETIHENAISRLSTAETKDPGYTNPDLKHEVFLHNAQIGASNPIVARISIQANRLLQHFFHGETERNISAAVNTKLCEARDDLLRAEEISNSLILEINELNDKYHKSRTSPNAVISVQKIENMHQRVKEFFSHLKSFLKNLIQIVNPIFNVDVTEAHFHNLKKILSEKLPENDTLFDLLEKDGTNQLFIEMIVEMRNALEHTNSQKKEFTLRNYEYEADGNIYEPQYSFTFKRKSDGQAYRKQGILKDELPSLIEGLLNFAEDFYVQCITYKVDTQEGLFSVVTLAIEKVEKSDPKCPVKYKWHLQPREGSGLMNFMKKKQSDL